MVHTYDRNHSDSEAHIFVDALFFSKPYLACFNDTTRVYLKTGLNMRNYFITQLNTTFQIKYI